MSTKNDDEKLQGLFGVTGDAVYFHHIHSRKAVKQSVPRDDFRNFKVEGKARRMLLLRKQWWFDLSSIDTKNCIPTADECHWYPVRGKPGYLVVQLVSDAPEHLKKWFIGPFTNLLDSPKDEKRTWIGLRPFIYPAECCSHGTNQPRTTVKQSVVDEIMKEMGLRGLGFDPPDPLDPLADQMKSTPNIG